MSILFISLAAFGKDHSCANTAIVGTEGDDRIIGTNPTDIIDSRAGEDLLHDLLGADTGMDVCKVDKRESKFGCES